jgi:hypothetical protein
VETGARARGLAGWARERALGDGVSGRWVVAAKVLGAYTRMTAQSGRVLDPPLRMPAKMLRGGARCAILIGYTAIRNLRIRLKPHDMFFSSRSKIACLRARFAQGLLTVGLIAATAAPLSLALALVHILCVFILPLGITIRF